MFHYLEPTNSTFGDQPHLRDPLAKKYLYLKDSDTYSLGDCRSTLSTRINFKPIENIKKNDNGKQFETLLISIKK